MPTSALLLIDPQNDFCDPTGALYVPGADADMQRVAQWVKQMAQHLDFVCYTLDSHIVHAIFHPAWWQDAAGNAPPPFTQITYEDVQTGRWTPRQQPAETREYLAALEAQGRFTHTIWPEHCLMGSPGAAVYPPVLEAILNWSRQTGREYWPVVKGTYPAAEHYGIFAAEVPHPARPETYVNTALLAKLAEYDRIYLAGEAESHCVGTTLRQLLDEAQHLASRITVLKDAMSPVPGFETLAAPIYARAKALGVGFETIG